MYFPGRIHKLCTARNCRILLIRGKMSTKVTCRLVCPKETHKPITLPHNEDVIIGRSVQMRIADKKVSRQHLQLTANCDNKTVNVKQLGTNPAQIGENTILDKGSSTIVSGNSTLYIIAGTYPNQIEFSEPACVKESSKPAHNKRALKDVPQEKRTIGDFFSKKPKNANDNKRPRNTDRDEHSESKRQKTDVREDEEEEEDDEENIRRVQERLKKMKKAFDEVSPISSEKPALSKAGQSRKDVPEKQGNATESSSWDQHERLLIYTSSGVRSSSKIAAFDIDGCIITTKSGKVFAQSTDDWKIQFSEIYKKLRNLSAGGFKVVFFTNQMGIARGKVKEAELKKKMAAIVAELKVPVQVFVASGPGRFRKPGLGMWNFLLEHRNDNIEVNISQSFYVGDAAGRPADWAPKKKKDFAISDRLFAINAGLTFHTPEEYFLGYRKATFTMPDFDPRTLAADVPMFDPSSTNLTLGEQEVIINCGLPASGKSHFSKTHLVPKGYAYVNRDTLGSWQKCVAAVKTALCKGQSVVVDNTNVDLESRQRYIAVAKAAKVPCRCFWFDVSVRQCRHNERFREMTDKSHQAINDMIFNQLKAKFKPPVMSEGFTEVAKVNFVPAFKEKSEEKLYRQFLFEK